MNNYEYEHINLLRPYLSECMVLLKKDGNFPLEKPCRIAACGNGIRHTKKGGTGSGEVYSRYYVNIEQGLKDAGFEIISDKWLDEFDRHEALTEIKFIEDIKSRAKKKKVSVYKEAFGAIKLQSDYDFELDYSGDAAIFVVSRICGEGYDRTNQKGDYKLTDSEIRDILALNENYEKFMLVINTGSPVDLSPVKEVKNILYMSQLGVETGAGLADVLLGKQNPSGRLASSWSAYEDYCDIGEFGNLDDTRYKEGIYVGYRYFDAFNKKPLYPFGYGLSYSEFDSEVKDVSYNNGKITVKVNVTNTGSYAGKNVVQTYISCPQGKLDKEIKSLACFGKTDLLKPGDAQTLEMSFELKDFASYDTESESYILEKGIYVVLVGNNVIDAKQIKGFELEHDLTVKKVRNLFGKTDFEDYRNNNTLIIGDIPIEKIELNIETETVDYNLEQRIDERVTDLSDEELAYLNMGTFVESGGLLATVGNASISIPGAAGESTHKLESKGIKTIVVADGPAGLRIAKEYYEDEKGVHAIGLAIPESIFMVMPKMLRKFIDFRTRPKKGVEIKKQYTTAIPIGTAIAQSFNMEFARICGDIVGSEMELFNVDVWLAPALNIHRNVLCGRNFEYYSEDPLVSGEVAAAITDGVQKHKRGVTIKHFAANNQETNRYLNNSVVSERALREIYLKGFAICINKSKPYAIMSSYNLINGTHSSETRELITDYLRCETVFDGLVMTDWIIVEDTQNKQSRYCEPDPAKVARSGHSMFMPGDKDNYSRLLEGIKNGTVDRKQLQINATYLLDIIDRVGKQ